MTSAPAAPRVLVLASFAPLTVLALASLWCGTFYGGAGAEARVTMAASVLALALVGAHDWRDPLGVGGVLELALLVSILGSFFASPVRRAGLEVVVLLPAFALVVAATARCWQGETAQRWALRGVGLLVAAVSSWAVLDYGRRAVAGAASEAARATMPLGHHNLLAAWLVGLLPLAFVGLRESGWWRLVGGLAVVLGGCALALTGSLAGLLVGSLQLLIWAWRRPRHGRRSAILIGTVLAVLVFVLEAPRLSGIAGLEDPSLRIRLVYADGALRGAMQHPVLGWGPGAARWTLGRFLDSTPGWRPPGEVVTDPHSLPLQIAFDLGGSGLVLTVALAGLFLWRRLRELGTPVEGVKGRGAALLGLVGLGLMSVAGRPFSAAVLPLLAALLAGASLAGPLPRRPTRPWPAWLYCLLAAALLVRPSLAALNYERGVRAQAAGAPYVDRAVRLDPDFPLYRIHRALGLAAIDPASSLAAEEAGLAARGAIGLAPLWLVAGILASDAGDGSAGEALVRACELDPLAPLAPFRLLHEEEDPRLAAQYGARALLADPVLAAAVDWNEEPARFGEALSLIERWQGLEQAWRRDLLTELRRVERWRRRGSMGDGELLIWSLEVDGRPSTALALHAFRRTPWTFEIGLVELQATLAKRLTLPGAGELRSTSSSAFPKERCAAPKALSRSVGRQRESSSDRAVPMVAVPRARGNGAAAPGAAGTSVGRSSPG